MKENQKMIKWMGKVHNKLNEIEEQFIYDILLPVILFNYTKARSFTKAEINMTAGLRMTKEMDLVRNRGNELTFMTFLFKIRLILLG